MDYKKIAILILLILIGIISIYTSKTENFAVNNIVFLNKKSVSNIFKNNIGYLKSFNSYDIKSRNLRTSNVLKFYQDRILEFTEKDKDFLSKAVQIIKTKARKEPRKWRFLYSMTWKFAKLSDELEYSFPHTHSDTIFIPETMLKSDLSDKLIGTLVHEMIHVWQRKSPNRFEYLYQYHWKFTRVENICNSSKYLKKMRSNPDIHHIFYIFNNNILPLTIFDDLYNTSFVGIPIKNFKIDDSKKVLSLTEIKEYNDFFGISYNHYHPNELSAELLSKIFIDQRVNSPATKKLEKWLDRQY